ncbi:MAG: hypothetical protein R2942_17590 [Ignavibacteria bacterium]
MHKHEAESEESAGGIVKREAPDQDQQCNADMSKTNEPTRIGMKFKDETAGKFSRMRTSKKSGEIIIS